MSFPTVRMRRLRRTDAIRKMLKSITLEPNNIVYPIFIDESIEKPMVIESMPGYSRLPISLIAQECKQALNEGVKSVLLFGIPSKKDEVGTSAYAKDGVIQRAIQELKQTHGEDLVVIGDVCLCEYMSHGHCGIVKKGEVQNDETLDILGKVAVSQAEAGVDIVAPSAMMDGQVGAIREALDDAGFEQVSIMAYSVKYASAFYGPFRDAAESTPKFGNRRAYQMNYGSIAEALREMELDIAEGADMLMIKPALPYLDIISIAKANFNLPIVAFHVSGEYSMLKAAANNGWIDEKMAIREMMMGIKRAGADLIISYFAKNINSWLE